MKAAEMHVTFLRYSTKYVADYRDNLIHLKSK